MTSLKDTYMISSIRHDLLKRCRLSIPLTQTSLPQVDLAGIGRAAEGFTGADLSSLLSEAQLAAVHEALDKSNAEGVQVCAFMGLHAALTCVSHLI